MLFHCLDRVIGAARVKAAALAQKRAQCELVDADE